MFASIFVAADNALVIDRKMPFPDKGLFSVRAGGGRIPEKLLIGAGAILHRRRLRVFAKRKVFPTFVFHGAGSFRRMSKKSLFRELFRTRRYGFLRQCADGYELKNEASAIKPRKPIVFCPSNTLNDDPCRRVFFNNAFFRLKKTPSFRAAF